MGGHPVPALRFDQAFQETVGVCFFRWWCGRTCSELPEQQPRLLRLPLRGWQTQALIRMSSIAADPMPDAFGHFGPYGGRFVPETLMHPLQELQEEYARAQKDPQFQRELDYYLRDFCGRPTPLYFAERLTRELGGAKIYLKREDLLH